MWLVGVGEIYGCGCKEVYRFPHTTYPYSSCICSFLQQHPYFLFIKKKSFSFLFQYFFVITFYVLLEERMPNHDFFYFAQCVYT